MGSDPRADTGVRPQYLRPESLDELLTLLRVHDGNAGLLAGGTDLLVRLRKGMAPPPAIIDLKRVTELRDDITTFDGGVRIGARAVMTDVIAHPSVRQHFPALVEAAAVVGSVQIRNRATLAGNLCNASPAADTAPALLAYAARLNLVSGSGSRHVALDEFFAGPGRTVLAPAEIVESIDVPLPTERTGSAFERVARRRGVDLAIVNLCCVVLESGDARFAFGAVGPRPFLVTSRQDAPIEDALTRATPISDLRGSDQYPGRHASSARPPRVEHRRRTHAARRRPRVTVTITVNGTPRTLDVEVHRTLLGALRDQLHLTGTKECCAEGECGACTVLLNGRAVNACLVLAVECDGEAVVTIEGIAADGQLDAVQQAFVDSGAVQCGFCIPGMIVAARYLLATNPHPSEDEIKEGLAGNLCRCGGYSRIVRAVKGAAT